MSSPVESEGPLAPPSAPSLRSVVVLAVASRLLSLALIGVAAAIPGGYISWADGNPYLAWDGWWYVQVATNGYHVDPIVAPSGYDFAFFPFWPALIRVVSAGLLPLDWTAVILSNLLFVVAAVLVYRVLAAWMSARAALLGVALWSFAPPAYVASLAYAEPVFVIAAAAYFLQQSPIRQFGLAALAMLTRLTGLALVVAALFTPGRRWLALAPIAAFAAWWAWLGAISSDPLLYWKGSPGWYGGDPAGLAAVWRTLNDLDFFFVAILAFLAAVIAGAAAMLKVHRPMALYALACVGLTLLTAIPESMSRHAWAGFPAFGGLALLLPGRRGLALLALFGIGQVVFGLGSIWRGLTP